MRDPLVYNGHLSSTAAAAAAASVAMNVLCCTGVTLVVLVIGTSATLLSLA